LAKNRYGWQKRAKELARKQKHDEKMRRRQNKGASQEVEESPVTPETEEEMQHEPEESDLQISQSLQE
jgi:hypothetical protein